MDIGLLSIALHQGQANQQASVAILKKTMDMAEDNASEFIHKMMDVDVTSLQHVAQPHLGGNIDIKG